MQLLEEKVQEEIKGMFNDLKGNAKLVVFTQDGLITVPGQECATCKDNRQLMEEVAALSDKMSIEIYDFVKDKEKVQQYKIDKIPATIVEGSKDHGIRFYGLPAGYEFPSLLNAIKLVSTTQSALTDETKAKLKTLSKPAHIQVFVTLTCPYCSTAAATAHRMAYESDYIKADVVDAQQFPQLAQKYNIFAVPKVVINEITQFEGALQENAFLEKILDSVK